MNKDTLGFRAKIGIIIPSTNTIVEPEMAAMQPVGVTNHIGRMFIPNMSLGSDVDFLTLAAALLQSQKVAVDSVMSSAPDHLILGLSSETFWSSITEGQAETEALRHTLGIGVSTASEAMIACLQAFDLPRVAVLTPFKPIGDARVRSFFGASGIEIVGIKGLCCNSPSAPAQVSRADLAKALRDLADCRPDVIIQVGTNLPTARLSREAFDWLGLPVLAANTILYRDALKQLDLLDNTGFCDEWMPIQR